MGYNDEVLDLSFVGHQDSHLAVATNSSQLRVYDVRSRDCQLLDGHTNIVLTLAANHDGTMLATGSKVGTILWLTNTHKINFFACNENCVHCCLQ